MRMAVLALAALMSWPTWGLAASPDRLKALLWDLERHYPSDSREIRLAQFEEAARLTSLLKVADRREALGVWSYLHQYAARQIHYPDPGRVAYHVRVHGIINDLVTGGLEELDLDRLDPTEFKAWVRIAGNVRSEGGEELRFLVKAYGRSGDPMADLDLLQGVRKRVWEYLGKVEDGIWKADVPLHRFVAHSFLALREIAARRSDGLHVFFVESYLRDLTARMEALEKGNNVDLMLEGHLFFRAIRTSECILALGSN